MSFSIAFLDEPVSYRFEDATTPAAYGELAIGNHREGFYASLYEWSKEDYESQWRHALRSLLEGKDRAALIVEYISPLASRKLEWWPMYAVGETVFLQNHLLSYEQLTRPFSMQEPYASLPDRRTINEDGNRISEWSISFPEIEEFARSFGL